MYSEPRLKILEKGLLVAGINSDLTGIGDGNGDDSDGSSRSNSAIYNCRGKMK
jgi:hypothetical protein